MKKVYSPVLLLFLAQFTACTDEPRESSQKSLYDANGAKISEALANSTTPSWRVLEPVEGFTGIGALGVDLTLMDPDVCTAFLVDTGVDSAPAYALTNAHCNFFEHFGFDLMKNDEYRTNLDTSYFLVLNHFASVPGKQRVKIPFRKLTYITETDTDVAIFETTKTVGQMKAMGFRPLRLRPTAPKMGELVQLVGIPLRTRAYHMQSLHISKCTVGEVVKLRNGPFEASQSVKHKCSSIPGFSGGPMVAQDGTVVLLNSHGTDDFSADPACSYQTMPCEVRADGQTAVDTKMNYAQPVSGIAHCFDSKGRFNLETVGCSLLGAAK